MTKTLWLKEGTVVKFECGLSGGTYAISGSTLTIKGGQPSKLWFNNVLQAQAGGGQGAVNNTTAPSGVTAVVWYNGNNTQSSTSSVHWHTGSPSSPGGCYQYTKHSHTGSCPTHVETEQYYYQDDACSICHARWGGQSNDWSQSGGCSGHTLTREKTVHDCGGHPLNTDIQLVCGYSNGQILNRAAQSVGVSINTWNADNSSQSNTGHGKFSIQLVEQNSLFYGSKVLNPKWLENRVNVVVMKSDDGERYATYVKHGNLN